MDWCVFRSFMNEKRVENVSVMEYLAGGSCLDLLQAGPFSEAHIAILCRELLLGLDYLHTEGKIHRDIKGSLPTNAPNSLLTQKSSRERSPLLNRLCQTRRFRRRSPTINPLHPPAHIRRHPLLDGPRSNPSNRLRPKSRHMVSRNHRYRTRER